MKSYPSFANKPWGNTYQGTNCKIQLCVNLLSQRLEMAGRKSITKTGDKRAQPVNQLVLFL
jgi:hypothetical protein